MIALLAAPTCGRGAEPAPGSKLAAPTEIEKLVVTGQRKSEVLQKAPVSVTVLSRSVLRAAGVRRATDFIALTPGVSLVTNTAEAGDVQLNIRGINSARDANPSFALVIDGILEPNPSALNTAFLDLQQIEVLKGPQNAIYGRDAEAGAVVITTVPPARNPTRRSPPASPITARSTTSRPSRARSSTISSTAGCRSTTTTRPASTRTSSTTTTRWTIRATTISTGG